MKYRATIPTREVIRLMARRKGNCLPRGSQLFDLLQPWFTRPRPGFVHCVLCRVDIPDTESAKFDHSGTVGHVNSYQLALNRAIEQARKEGAFKGVA